MIKMLWRVMLATVMMKMAEGTGGAEGAVDAPTARQFVTGFLPDPKVLEGMQDHQVMAYHGQVSKLIGDHVTKARETYDWRKDVAGDNPDALKTLERFASPKALFDSYGELRGRMAKGELKAVTPFPDKGTPEQQAQWRAEAGVPADPTKYEWKLPTGMVIGENDKPLLESLAKHAHAKNIPAAAANEIVGWYMQERVAREEAARAQFDTLKNETAAALGAEWGVEYKPNLNKIQGLLDSTIPGDQEELKTQINNAIATNPHFARHYAALALQLNPGGTLVTGDHSTNVGSVTDEIKKIEAQARADRNKYNKDEPLQARYRDLLAGYQRLTGKAWGQPG